MLRESAVPKATWEKVKKEYIAGKVPMRELARKYGLAVSTISERAKKDGWKDIQERVSQMTEQQLVERLVDYNISNAELATHTIHILMEKLAQAAEMVGPGDTRAAREITQCMKDLKDMEVYGLDAGTKEADIKVELLPEIEDYSE